MMYAWNGFQLLCNNQSLLEGAMRVVWDELMTVEETQGNKRYHIITSDNPTHCYQAVTE